MQTSTASGTIPLRILLIEDNEDDAWLIVDQIESGGYTLDWQRVDNEACLRTALKQNWDIVFSDYSIPGFSGKRAFEIFSETKQTSAFIYVSGTIGEEAAVSAIKAGANDYIMKSNLDRLLPTISKELREMEARRNQKRTEETLKKLSLAVNQSSDSIFITNPLGEIEYVNPAFEQMTGYSSHEVLGKKADGFELEQDSQHSTTKIPFWHLEDFPQPYLRTLEKRHKTDARYYEERMITPLYDESGKISHYVAISRDITSRVLAEEGRRRLSAILEATPDIVFIIKPPGELLYLNSAGHQLLGIDTRTCINGMPIKSAFPKNLQSLYANIERIVLQKGHWTGEAALNDHSGKCFPVSLVALSHQNADGDISHISMIARDISERKNFEEALQHRATHDDLTGLPNRFFLMDRFNSALQHAKRNRSHIAVLFIDLDNFKRVNDSFGHSAGDQLLIQVSERLKNCLRPNDTIARNGGDEFTIIITDLPNYDSALSVLSKLHHTVDNPVHVEGTDIYASFSTGVAIYPEDGDCMEDLLKHADIAMYQAKNSTANQYRFYAASMNIRGQELLELEAELRRAITEQQFELFYQPQVSVRTGKIVAAEALIRWRHPDRGLIGPSQFIPLLESTGLIIPVGEWVIRTAAADLNRLSRCTDQRFRVCANVSALQFSDRDFISKVAAALQDNPLHNTEFELEITENTVMKSPENAVDIIKQLRNLNVRTAIDDFGTGYSSLGYLKIFPINTLKIDQIFVKDLGGCEHDAAIVDASITLAQKLHLEVIAEGVETTAQFEHLRQRGCDLAQGYLFSQPIPVKDFEELLQKGESFI
jgi:diguanylate cyclase (GGDEF)-like protein/PAS domain S-box-containing protein